MTESTDYASFRRRLDTALRTRDVHQVRAFLIEEDQWSLEQPADPEYAMWLMIAGTPTLKDLHAQARQWLTGHGHAEAAEAVLSRDQTGKPGPLQGRPVGADPQKARQRRQKKNP